jgi:AraC-like DNA-binding protein
VAERFLRASARGIRIAHYRCTAGPHDPVFEEQHASTSISIVRRGRFLYHRDGRVHALGVGSLLLGSPGQSYACSHDHGVGDDCLSFELEEAVLQPLGPAFALPALPPLPRLDALALLADAAIDGRSSVALDEVGVALAMAVQTEIARHLDRPAPALRDRAVDRRRAMEAAAFIDDHFHTPLDLATVAAEVDLSPFHFLRLFRAQLGVTPHQYLVRARLRRALALLLDSDRPVTDVCYEVGFEDLSNFVRTFHREVGCSPGAMRGPGQRKILQVASRRLG